jgi:hypothetical protein
LAILDAVRSRWLALRRDRVKRTGGLRACRLARARLQGNPGVRLAAARRTAMLKQMRARGARHGVQAQMIETLNALTAYHLRCSIAAVSRVTVARCAP